MSAPAKVLGLALAASLALSGCVAVPLPPLGAQHGAKEIASLEPGMSTRQDVRRVLGEPELALTARYDLFELSEEDLNVLVIPVLLPVAGFGPIGEARHRVLAAYGPDEILQSLEWEALVDGQAVALAMPDSEASDAARAEIPPQLLAWQPPTNWGSSLSVSPDGTAFAVSYAVGEAEGRARSLTQLRDPQSAELLQEIEYGPVGCPLLVPPSRTPFWGQPDPTVFLGNGLHLASIARDGVICIWNPETQRGVLTLDAGADEVSRLASAQTSPILASANSNGLVKLWDGVTGREIVSISPCASEPGCDHDGRSLVLALSDDGRLLVTSQYGGRSLLGARSRGVVRFWDATSGRELASVALPREGTALIAQKLALAPDRSRLAVHLGDHVEIWRLGDAFAERTAQGGDSGTAMAVELERVLLLPLDDETAYAERSLGFSRDGTRLVAGNGNAVGWDTATWRQSWRMVPGASDWALGTELGQGYAVASDGRRIVTAKGVWAVP